MLLVVLTILNMCVLVFCVVSVSEFMALSMVFSMWTGPGFIFESCREFLIFQ